ncbi:hypothetical protein AGMMS4956_04350 [Bacteroidia bacterium]|nr:hypothetical protein AGMMS4956_04350 [Bacteroidia bacterium]
MDTKNKSLNKISKIKFLSINEIHEKYYRDVMDSVFSAIVAADTVSSRPQKGKLGMYAKWLLNLYKRGNLKTEDLYKAQEYLPIFDKAAKANKIRIKDLNHYKSLAEMYMAIAPFIDQPAISKTDHERHIKENEAEKLYEDDIFVVIYPKTMAASCYYGKGTQWCTAATNSRYNAFDKYNSKGKLYIIIDKARGKKYQFHFETEQFMDEKNEELMKRWLPPILINIEATSGLMQFFQTELSNRYAAIIARNRKRKKKVGYLMDLGNILDSLGIYQAAIECYQKLTKLDPKEAHCYYDNMAFIYKDMEDYEQAIQCSQKSLAIKPENPVAYKNLARIYCNIGNYEQVLLCAQKLLVIHTKDYEEIPYLAYEDMSDAYNYMANAHNNMGHYEQALLCSQASLALELDDNIWAQQNMARAYDNMGNYEQALQYYHEVAFLEPEETYKDMSRIYHLLGDEAQADFYYQKVKEINPNFTL